MTAAARVAKAAPAGSQFVFASIDSTAIAPAMHKAKSATVKAPTFSRQIRTAVTTPTWT
jgi:hypothetical protein